MPGIHEEGTYNDFYYTYKIALRDADRSKPITSRLQLRDVKGGGWQDVSGSTQVFSGSSGEWTGTIRYDMIAVDLGGEDGILREMRIVCSYKMADGSDGTIYSSSCGRLWSYKGSYLSPISAELRDDVITARFQVDTDLISHPELLKPVEVTLSSGTSSWDILGSAVISGPESNGTLTLTYTLNGESLDTSTQSKVFLVLNYTDEEGAISWDDASAAQFLAHDAPVLELTLGMFSEGYAPGYGVSCLVRLNGLLGGQAKITLQKLGPDGFKPIEEFGTLTYSAGDEDEHGTLEFAFYDSELDALWGVDDEGRRYKAKFVIDYVYPDGTTGVLESPVFEQYGGGFGHYANSPAIVYDAENHLLVAEVELDLSLVEPEYVSVIASSSYFDVWTSLPQPTLRSSGYAPDGSYRMVFALPLETLTAGEYSYDIALRFSNGVGPVWEQELYVYCNLG